MKVKIHDENYLIIHHFEDTDGDFWEDEEAYDKWSNESNISAPTNWLVSAFVGTIQDKTTVELYQWAIEKRLPKEDYPEYYL